MVTCDSCKERSEADVIHCTKCGARLNKKGWLANEGKNVSGNVRICPMCNGRGKLIPYTCEGCHGAGRIVID